MQSIENKTSFNAEKKNSGVSVWMFIVWDLDHLTAVLLEFFTKAKHKYDSAQDTSHDILADKHLSHSTIFSLEIFHSFLIILFPPSYFHFQELEKSKLLMGEDDFTMNYNNHLISVSSFSVSQTHWSLNHNASPQGPW